MDGIGEVVFQVVWGFYAVLEVAAPWLLIGLALSALVRAFVPESFVLRWLGGGGVGAAFRGAVVGAPLPLCSCGVAPMAIALRRRGASRAGTISFLVATPATGPDSITLTWALLGPFMAVARIISAVVAAVVAGTLAMVWGSKDAPERGAPGGGGCCHEPAPVTPCGCSGAPGPEPASCCHAPASDPAPCCEGGVDAASRGDGFGARLGDGLRFAFGRLFEDLAPWIVVGLVVAGALQGLATPETLARLGSGPLAMLAMAVVGVPIYVCATAYTPIAAALIAAGLSPGAAIVLLLAGPATNLGVVGIVKNELGVGATVGYLLGVCGVAIASGLAVDAVLAATPIEVVPRLGAGSHPFPLWFDRASAVVLALLLIKPVRDRLVGASRGG